MKIDPISSGILSSIVFLAFTGIITYFSSLFNYYILGYPLYVWVFILILIAYLLYLVIFKPFKDSNNNLVLNLDWFKMQVHKNVTEEEFNPILHVDTYAEQKISNFLVSEKTLYEDLNYYLDDLKGRFGEYIDLKRSNENSMPPAYSSILISDLYSKLDILETKIEDLIKDVQKVIDKSNLSSNELVSEQFWDDLNKIFADVNKSYWKIVNEFSDDDEEDQIYFDDDYDEYYKDYDKEDNEIIIYFRTIFGDMPHINDHCLAIRDQLRLIKQPDLHIFGKAGTGKTHLSASVCTNQLNKGYPALLLTGRSFTTNEPLHKQIMNILDLPPIYSWNEFLKSLENVSEEYGVRIPIVIDALNESNCNGKFGKIWKNDLKRIIKEISNFKGIILITTTRETYKNAIWDHEPQNSVLIDGFDLYNVEEAIDKYFDYYKIESHSKRHFLYQFEHPIYLKIFCETKNPNRSDVKTVYLGDYTLFEIFDEYLDRIDQNLCKALDRHDAVSIIYDKLDKIAEYLLKENRSSIPLNELTLILDNEAMDSLNWSMSKTKAFLDESLLINKDWFDKGEIVFFTYDLLAGYVIAKHIMNTFDNLEDFVRLDSTKEKLFDGNNSSHPLYEDINRCISALLPIRTGKFIHEITDNEFAFNFSVNAIFEIPIELIDSKIKNFISKLFETHENRRSLLKLAESVFRNVEHPLNIVFWSEQLKKLSINERDLTWSENIRQNIRQIESEIQNFEKICYKDEIKSEYDEKHIITQAKILMWYLTSNVSLLRDISTKALYWYSRRLPKNFMSDLEFSFEINDPYVLERMIAVAYGLSIAIHNNPLKDSTKEVLEELGTLLYNKIFKKDASNSTTHFLTREYARRIIEIALIYYPEISSEIEVSRINPPYTDGGIRKWGESEDKDKGKYREGNNPLDGIIREDLISLLGPEMDKYTEPPEYLEAKRQILWRMYNLGYSLSDFGDFDKEISQLSAIGRNTHGISLYGRKYAKIAFYELAGFRDDNNLLRFPHEIEGERASFLDIDPSFPKEMQEFLLIKKDFLSKYGNSVEKWILSDNAPNLNKYLKVNKINNNKGPWVLMYGSVDQVNKNLKKRVFIYPTGLLIKTTDQKEILKKLNKQENNDIKTPFIPTIRNIYTGEIPWIDLFKENSKQELEVLSGKSIQTHTKKNIFFSKNGVPITYTEEKKIWDKIDPKIMIILPNNTDFYWKDKKIDKKEISILENDLKEKELKISSEVPFNYISLKIVENQRLENEDNDGDLLLDLLKSGLEFSYFEEKIEYETPVYKKCDVLFPITQLELDLSLDSVTTVKNKIFLNKQLCNFFDLVGKPQTFDLFEKNGEKASICISYKSEESRHYLYFLRKDLLDKFLASEGYSFLWLTWGEKQFYSENFQENQEFKSNRTFYKKFIEVKDYSSLNSFFRRVVSYIHSN